MAGLPYTMTAEKLSSLPKQKTTLQLSLPLTFSRQSDTSRARRHTLTVPPVSLFSSKARSPRVAFKPFAPNDQVGFSAHAHIFLHIVSAPVATLNRAIIS